MSLTPARSKAAAPRRIAVFSLRSGCTPSRSSSRSQDSGSSTKYSWLPVTKNDPSRDTKSRNGSAAGPSSSTVPSTRSPTIATRSGSVSLIIRTIRSVCARPDSGPRWMSDTTAIRNPLNAGSSRRSRTGTCSRSGGPSALAAPTPTRLTDAAPAATALGPGEEHPPVHRRRRRGLILGDRLGRGVAVASSGFRFTQPRSASRTGSSTSSARNRYTIRPNQK